MPTKIPASRSPVNHRDTDKRNDKKAESPHTTLAFWTRVTFGSFKRYLRGMLESPVAFNKVINDSAGTQRWRSWGDRSPPSLVQGNSRSH